jgi:hypothetical protein
MYENPTIHTELARLRHGDVLAAAAAQHTAARAEPDSSGRLPAVRGVFSGILSAVANVTSRSRPAPQKPGLQGAG